MNGVTFGGGAYVESLLHRPVVEYDEIVALIQTGDLLFASGRALPSRLISCGTGSPWSHVGMVLKSPLDPRAFLIEAPATDTLRVIDLHDYVIEGSAPDSVKPYHGQLVLARPLAFVSEAWREHLDDTAEKLRSRIMERVHQGFPGEYDWPEIIRIMFLLICGHRWRRWRKRHAKRRQRLHDAEAKRIMAAPVPSASVPVPDRQRKRTPCSTDQSRARRLQRQNVYTCSELVGALLSLHPPYAELLADGLEGDGFITPGDLAEQIPNLVIARIRA